MRSRSDHGPGRLALAVTGQLHRARRHSAGRRLQRIRRPHLRRRPVRATHPALLNALRQNGLAGHHVQRGPVRRRVPGPGEGPGRAPACGSATTATPTRISPSRARPRSTRRSPGPSRPSRRAGGGTPKLFRPPYGETNATVQAVEAKYGLTADHLGRRLAGLERREHRRDRRRPPPGSPTARSSSCTTGPPTPVAAIPRIAQGLAARGLCAGMISPQTGRAVAPG